MALLFIRSSGGIFIPPEEVTFPRTGGYPIGGASGRRYDDINFINAAAACNGPVIGAWWPGWESGKTRTMPQITNLIHSTTTTGASFYGYLIVESTAKSNATPGEALYGMYDYHQTNGLWAYANGLTKTTQRDSYDPLNYQINHTTSAEVVAGKRSYQWSADWYISWLFVGATISNGIGNLTNSANPNLDGAFIDNFFPQFDTDGAADMNRDGTADTYTGSTSRLLCQNSNVALKEYIESVLPGKLVLGNSARF